MTRSTLALVTVLLLLITQNAFARVQYAVKRGIKSCTACHYSPTGGGPKNLFGKAVASHDLGNGPSSNQDYVSGDLGYLFEHATKDLPTQPAGLAQMYAIMSGVAPIVVNNDGSNYRLVGSYNLNGSSIIQSYLRIETTSSGGIKPKHIMFGKFNLAFGLLTDEHRTYTRLQTNTRYYDDTQIGAMFSGDLNSFIHYDFAITNWYKEGNSPPPTKDFQVGLNPNLRIFLGKGFLGISGLYYHDNNKKDPWAYSLYSAFALNQNLTLLTEFTWAKNFNNDSSITNNLSKFVSNTQSPNYYNSLANKTSVGSFIRLDYDLSRSIVLFNKNDIFIPDQTFLKDFYLASAFGIKYRFNSNIDMDARYEKTILGRSGINETKVNASINRVMVYGHMWF